ncbi:Crp/Fnr family transcriptional regulator [Odoribacter sp. OttesenSCG-928-L07]|nr:Crp/Fnr family transcriptional regulator [Odoribacter sp. OttesenSCG-928-L07]MDL2240861.1 Crp/Fnr family transcriptional regulator [Bacteroidales bacterium OttesenSCG-928-K22]
METLISIINEHHKLAEEEELLLRQTLRTLHFPKGSVVIEEGKIDDSIYFIRQGVWRAHIEREGEDCTLWFAVQGETVFSSWGHIRNLPSRMTISSSSNSVVIEMKKSTVQKLSEMSPSFNSWLHLLYVDMILNSDNQLVDISYPKAEKRYLAFMKKMPEIFQHVPLKEVAGFIGVTPQSLSRIRAKI